MIETTDICGMDELNNFFALSFWDSIFHAVLNIQAYLRDVAGLVWTTTIK